MGALEEERANCDLCGQAEDLPWETIEVHEQRSPAPPRPLRVCDSCCARKLAGFPYLVRVSSMTPWAIGVREWTRRRLSKVR